MSPVVDNLSTFPFYGPVFDWDHIVRDWNSRKYWAFGQAYPFIVPQGTLPTAQAYCPDGIDDVGIYPISVLKLPASPQDWSPYRIPVPSSCFRLSADVGGIDGNDILVVNDPWGGISLPPGPYFMVIEAGDNYYYSDVFISSGDAVTPQSGSEFLPPENLLELAWWDEKDFVVDDGSIAYRPELNFPLSGYPNRVFLPTDIGMPNYLFEEEGETRDGYFFAIKQISKKEYRFSFLAPEYLCDSLRLVRMADHIRIRYGGHTYWATNFTPSFEWQEGGSLAAVTIEFETNTVAKKIGWGKNL